MANNPTVNAAGGRDPMLRSEVMTGPDLLVLTPWVLFGAALVVIWFRLRRSRRKKHK